MATGTSGSSGSTGTQHKCSCGKSFNSSEELREHEKTCKVGGSQRR